MINRSILIILIFLFIISCGPQRRIHSDGLKGKEDAETYCDSLKIYKSLYINKISANILLGEESYDARLSMFYVPDSLFFVSAVNSGFEIVRIAVTKDSIIYINRLEKVVFIYKVNKLAPPPPMNFEDLEILVNKSKLCNLDEKEFTSNTELKIDRSEQNIAKEIIFSKFGLSLQKFEFFQKKTAEYVVGERRGKKEFVIYSNYLIDDLIIKTSGGVLEYDKEMNIDLSVNRKKYDIVYF